MEKSVTKSLPAQNSNTLGHEMSLLGVVAGGVRGGISVGLGGRRYI